MGLKNSLCYSGPNIAIAQYTSKIPQNDFVVTYAHVSIYIYIHIYSYIYLISIYTHLFCIVGHFWTLPHTHICSWQAAG